MARHKILFVCVENAGRSQIAEAFFRKYAAKTIRCASAGTKPTPQVNPLVVQVMKEVGIDIGGNTPKSFSNEMISENTQTVNMGCMDKESCPALFVGDVIDWNISDPKGKSVEEIRRIRNQIENKVKNLIETLEDDS